MAVLGLVAWNLSLRGGKEGPLVREARAGNGRLTVIYLQDQHLAVLDFDLPPPGGDRTYQAWRVPPGGAPVSLGLLGARSPTAFRADLSLADTVAISVEPPGGSNQPTTTPLIAVGLSGSAGAKPGPAESFFVVARQPASRPQASLALSDPGPPEVHVALDAAVDARDRKVADPRVEDNEDLRVVYRGNSRVVQYAFLGLAIQV